MGRLVSGEGKRGGGVEGQQCGDGGLSITAWALVNTGDREGGGFWEDEHLEGSRVCLEILRLTSLSWSTPL